eukprot:c19390_g1_i1 orf=287-634(+)
MSAQSPVVAARRSLQQQRARLLYRRGLKHLLFWAGHGEIFYNEASKLRAEFDGNKNVDNLSKIDRLLLAGEEKLAKKQHPDPYIVPWAPGGSKFGRNTPVPPEIEVVFDYGKEEY